MPVLPNQEVINGILRQASTEPNKLGMFLSNIGLGLSGSSERGLSALEGISSGAYNYTQELRQRQKEQLEAKLQLAKFGSGIDDPSAVREYRYYQGLSPDQQSEYLRVKRSQQVLDQGGYNAVLDPRGGGFSQSFDKTPAPEQMPDFKAQQTTAVEDARNTAERRAQMPKATAAYNDVVAKNRNFAEKIDEVLPNIDGFTAGYAGQKLSEWAGTRAFDLNANLQSIRAQVGFDELQNMRNNSPTGGALGSVSENENRLLQSAVTNIENSQSPEQLKRNLIKLKQLKAESMERIRQAYEADLQRFGKEAMAGIQPLSGGDLNANYPAPNTGMPSADFNTQNVIPPAMPSPITTPPGAVDYTEYFK